MDEQNLKTNLEDAQAERTEAQDALQKSRRNLKRVQGDNQRRRDEAEGNLRTAETGLEDIQQQRKDLESEESRIVEEQKKNDDDLSRLNRQIRDNSREIDGIRAQVQIDTAERDRLLEAGEERQSDLATAEKNLRNSEDRLTKATRDLNNLKTQKRAADDEHERLETRKGSVGRQLSEKRSEERRADEEVSDARQNLRTVEDKGKEREEAGRERIDETRKNLDEKERAVAEIVEKINSQVTDIPKQFREKTSRLSNVQQFFGGTGIGYPYILMLGAIYEFVFYCLHGIDIFDYSTISDFLLVIPFAYGMVAAIFTAVFYTTVTRFLFFTTPERAETVANILSRFTQSGELTKHSIALLIVAPLFGSALGGFGSYMRDILTWNVKNEISIVTEPPLGQTNRFVLIGSNSQYIFLKDATRPSHQVRAIPLSRIVCLSEGSDGGNHSDCRATMTVFEREMLSHAEGIEEKIDQLDRTVRGERANYVTESWFRPYVEAAMTCENRERLKLSTFIRFTNAMTDLDQDPFYLGKYRNIEAFVNQWGRQATRWAVFGFSSPDGPSETNVQYAEDRAAFIKSKLCQFPEHKRHALNCDSPNEDVTYLMPKESIKPFGEYHPINGIANSRSAVIGVCVPDEEDLASRQPSH